MFYSGGSFTLNPQAAATVAPVVLRSADYTSYQALLAKGVVQNGSFVLASSNVYQAFQQLAANGTIQNGAFAFTNAGIQSNAQSILGSAFQQLTGYGALQGNTFVLGSNGVAYYAAGGAVGGQSTTYEALDLERHGHRRHAGAQCQRSVGLPPGAPPPRSISRARPTRRCRLTPTRSTAAFTQAIQTYGNTQYQANAAQAQTYANTQYQTFAQTIREYVEDRNGGGCGWGGCGNQNQLTDAQIAQWAQEALNNSEYTAFSALLARGTVANGALTLNAAGVLSLATDATLQAQKYATFQSLTTNGALSPTGTLILNAAALPTVCAGRARCRELSGLSVPGGRVNQNYQLTNTQAATYASYNQRIQTFRQRDVSGGYADHPGLRQRPVPDLMRKPFRITARRSTRTSRRRSRATPIRSIRALSPPFRPAAPASIKR